MFRTRLIVAVASFGCGSREAKPAPPPKPPADAALSIWDRTIDASPFDAPPPLEHPQHIDDCNLDWDCGITITCDCQRCVTHNKNVHVDQCPKNCDKTPACKKPVCRAGTCTFE